MVISVQTKPCAICGKVGQRIPVEKLPGNGILWRVSHVDGTVCEWSDYDSFENLRSAKDDNPFTQMECPKCGQTGLIVAERDDPVDKPDVYKYRIRHDDGKRHYVTQKDRDNVLKKIGRYIEKPSVISKRTRTKTGTIIICPKCGEQGTTGSFAKWSAVSHMRTDESGKKKQHRCYMNPEQKNEVEKLLEARQGAKPTVKKIVQHKTLTDKRKLLKTQEIIRKMHLVYQTKIREMGDDLDKLMKQIPKRGRGRPPKI